jgi:hypothetical protein
MGALTSRLKLYKPGGGSTGTILPDETADIDKLNSDFDLIDAAVGAPRFGSTTRPASPFDGQLIAETDTGALAYWDSAGALWRYPNPVVTIADLDALAALSAGSFEGRRFHVDSMGVDFEAIDGVWTQIGPAFFASTANRDTEYAKAAAAYRIIGATCFITTAPLVLMQHNGDQTSASSGWQQVGRIKPSAVTSTSGTVTIADDGTVTLVPVAAGTATFTKAFLPKAVYGTDVYKVEITISGTGQSFSIKLANAGVTDAGTTTYDYFGSYKNFAGADTAQTQGAGPSWLTTSGFSPINHEINLVLRHPGEAQNTVGDLIANNVITLGSSELALKATVKHRNAAVFDGMTLTYAAASTIIVKISPVI